MPKAGSGTAVPDSILVFCHVRVIIKHHSILTKVESSGERVSGQASPLAEEQQIAGSHTAVTKFSDLDCAAGLEGSESPV